MSVYPLMAKWYQVPPASRGLFHSQLLLRSPKIISPASLCLIFTLSTTNLIQDYIRDGNINDARKLFDENPMSCNTVTWNSMITGHIRNNQMQSAHDLFDRMPLRDVVSWNTMMSGFNNTKDPHKLHQLFLQMNRSGERPNHFTFSTIISGFLNSYNVLVPQVHSLILHLGLHSNIFVGSALMRGYTHLRDRSSLCQVFDDILTKDISTWNALLAGYADLGFIAEAQITFDTMPELNIISWTTLVNGYIKNKKINHARQVFDKMPQKNIISWTTMIKGYVQQENYTNAIQLFISMINSNIHPNHFTFSTLLDACANCSMFLLGSQLHSWTLKSGLSQELVLSTSLIDMYTKCGEIKSAFTIFNSMKTKNIVSWNSIIGGCARHGLAKRALTEFKKMIKNGVKPDNVTFINVLSACVHGGLVDEGEWLFKLMVERYGIEAEMKHYACMVDLYGKAGEVEKAVRLVEEMTFEPDVGVWGALLAGCGLHSCYEVADGVEKLGREYSSIYNMMIKIHGEKGAWDRVIEMREGAMGRGGKKQKAGSRVEFSVGVSKIGRSQEIY